VIKSFKSVISYGQEDVFGEYYEEIPDLTLEVKNVNDSTATDAWRPSSKPSKPLEGTVCEIFCEIIWNDQGWGNAKGKAAISLVRDGKDIAQ
jgi:hypothetical protein